MTLDGLEALLVKTFRPIRKLGKQLNPQVNICRYADDFIVTAKSKEVLNELRTIIEAFLEKRGLELSRTKTRITHIDDGFDFLGQNIRKYKGKLIIKPAKKNLANVLSKLRQLIMLHNQSTQAELIRVLNPVIKGWVNYHQYSCASETFSKLDHLIWKMLWRWAKRRHPNKSAAWLRQRYFARFGKTSWDFSCFSEDDASPSGKRRLSLHQASSTAITRHIKLKAEANPFDPAWELYFEQRLKRMMLVKLKGRKKLLVIWKRQKGKCLICKQVISKQTSWHLHHLIPKAQGGSNTQANLVLLHPNCHRQVHTNLELSVRLLALVKEGS
jgi:RNA-directed DNA polymerase